MTTIVCSRTEMACDSLCTDATTKCTVDKIYRVGDSLIGVAGAYGSCNSFIEWLKAGSPRDAVPEMDDVAALVLSPSGIYMYDGNVAPFRLKGKFAAIGSGAQAALALMHTGASPAMAVKMAIKVDPFSGGHVSVVKLDAPATKKKRKVQKPIPKTRV